MIPLAWISPRGVDPWRETGESPCEASPWTRPRSHRHPSPRSLARRSVPATHSIDPKLPGCRDSPGPAVTTCRSSDTGMRKYDHHSYALSTNFRANSFSDSFFFFFFFSNFQNSSIFLLLGFVPRSFVPSMIIIRDLIIYCLFRGIIFEFLFYLYVRSKTWNWRIFLLYFILDGILDSVSISQKVFIVCWTRRNFSKWMIFYSLIICWIFSIFFFFMLFCI